MNPEASCTIPQKVNVKRESCGVCGEEEAGTDDDTSDLPEGKLSWVECEECSVWYHFVCVGVVNNDSLGQYWVCDKCLN